MNWTRAYHAVINEILFDSQPNNEAQPMPKKSAPYNHRGREGTSPWFWAWDVPTSKGTGTPYIVSVRANINGAPFEAIWGCNCAAGRNGHPSCQHRMRVLYEIVTVQGMLASLPLDVRRIVAPDFAAVQSTQVYSAPTPRELTQSDDRRFKVVI